MSNSLTHTPAIETMMSFLSALLDQNDVILLRCIESCDDKTVPKTPVKTYYTRLSAPNVRKLLSRLDRESETDFTNLFFGVCPRLSSDGKSDLAIHIRTVRTLWADLDHMSVDEVMMRVETAQLPPPSIIVMSGNGVHLYWLLDEPYQITDADEPPALKTLSTHAQHLQNILKEW